MARLAADFTKAVFAVAVASQFFRGFTPGLKVVLVIMIIAGIIGSTLIEPKEVLK
jgi:hypothetical protein